MFLRFCCNEIRQFIFFGKNSIWLFNLILFIDRKIPSPLIWIGEHRTNFVYWRGRKKSRNDKNQTKSNLRCFRHMLHLKLDSRSASFLMKSFRYLLWANRIKGTLLRDGRLCLVFFSLQLLVKKKERTKSIKNVRQRVKWGKKREGHIKQED